MAYIYFQISGIFKSTLTIWDESEDDNKTWLSFKEHFRLAHKALKWTGALTVRETFDQDTVANMVQAELQQAFLDQELDSSLPLPLLPEQQVVVPSALTTSTASASNSMIASDLTMQSMQQQLALMQQMTLQQMTVVQQPMCQSISNDNGTIRPTKWNQMKYC